MFYERSNQKFNIPYKSKDVVNSSVKTGESHIKALGLVIRIPDTIDSGTLQNERIGKMINVKSIDFTYYMRTEKEYKTRIVILHDSIPLNQSLITDMIKNEDWAEQTYSNSTDDRISYLFTDVRERKRDKYEIMWDSGVILLGENGKALRNNDFGQRVHMELDQNMYFQEALGNKPAVAVRGAMWICFLSDPDELDEPIVTYLTKVRYTSSKVTVPKNKDLFRKNILSINVRTFK